MRLALVLLLALVLASMGYAELKSKNERAEAAAHESRSRFRLCDSETTRMPGPGMLDYCVHPDDREESSDGPA
jgi:hypothetical protein